MADNSQLSAAVGSGITVADDDIGGVKYPRSKIVIGADGVNDGDVSSANPLPVTVAAALPAGTNAIGKLAANSGVDIGDVDITSIAAGDNNIGNVDIVTVPADPFGANADAASATGSISAKLRFIASTGIPITGTVTVGSHAVTNAGTFATQAAPTAVISGGATPYYFLAAGGANQDSQVVKNGAGQVYSVTGFSLRTTPLYLRLYDKATGPTSSDTPVHVFQIPSQGTANGSGFTFAVPVGLAFANGISFRITTGIAVNDANAATAADCVVNIGYK